MSSSAVGVFLDMPHHNVIISHSMMYVGTVPHLLLWRSGLHESLVISVGKFVISLEILPCFIGSFTVVTGILT